MFPSIALIATAALYFTSVVDAAPSKRQLSDNGACEQLMNTCADAVDNSLSNVFSIESCVFAASCVPVVDGFLATLFSTKNGPNAGAPPKSINLPRVSSSVLNAISTDGKTISQQNFIDGFYGELSKSGGPWPSSSEVVVNFYKHVASWAAFCNGNIPFSNFQDYFQYSSTNPFDGCTPTSTTISPPAATTIVVSPDTSCQKMFTTCVDQVNSAVDNIFSIKSCVLGASCFSGRGPVIGFIAAVYEQKTGKTGPIPEPANEARVSTALFNAGSTDGGKTWTQQNFIDAWYSQLSEVGGPFGDVNLVIGYFQRIAVWTGFCDSIPYMNFADYFQWSYAVPGAGISC